jgi:hypothetical protein
MNLNAKKLRERKILDLVYEGRRVEEIVPSERPDFLVRTRESCQFGVEIAELYLSETIARSIGYPTIAHSFWKEVVFATRTIPSALMSARSIF